ncbi:hypothetical protein ACFWUW_27755 [Streptomyces sp. NPDC058655]|uniref:hypothetical protein n=1 Tax=Streptomyces sp. NPDC058655 TaxID=3346577 RepID=UPI003662A461
MSLVLFACGLFYGLTALALGSIGISIAVWVKGAFKNHYTMSVVGKNGVIYSVPSLGIAGVVSLVLRQVAGPHHAGVIVVAASVPVIACMMTGAFWIAPTATVAYGSWWMPAEDRSAYQQDMRCALAQVSARQRGKHAWGIVKSAPRAGLRARRFASRGVSPATESGHSARRPKR